MTLLRRARPAARATAVACVTAVGLLAAIDVDAAAPTTAPQVLLAITNSESMDGTTAGAIMTGSGGLGSTFAGLGSSSSPVSYTVDPGFTPPVSPAVAGIAPYTAACSSNLCDNSQSRLNMTKAAIAQVLSSYGNSLNFGVYTYAKDDSGSAPSPSLYSTWVYYMSPSSGFTFTNTASSTTVNNPCYNYSASSTSVSSACGSIAGIYGGTVVTSSKYMNIAASSDDAQINDVLYAGAIKPVFLTYGGASPANPYTYYGLSTYETNIGGYLESYPSTAPNLGYTWRTSPTNAGYVPFSPQVLYSQRGFGYGGAQSAVNGYVQVKMTPAGVATDFAAALSAETNSASTKEIKSFAGQSAIYGLLTGAKKYLDTLTKATCQTQYVVMLTDGLPTLDHRGYAWPPLGTTTANAYNLSATYAADGSFTSSNADSVTDAINAIKALSAAGIKVYVIGLGAGVDSTVNPAAAKLLTAMAIAGGTTDFFPAGSSTALNDAFMTIVDKIYSENSISAPVAPISVASGGAYEYQLTSIPSPTAGHVKAYTVSAAGAMSSTAAWDAPTLMTATNRAAALMAAKTDNTFGALAALDAGVWNLTATTCVPTTATIIAYTIDPNYIGTCTYLGARQSNWFLGGFSTQNTGRYVGPPASSLLSQKYSTYTAYARANASRTPMLMFTNDDGFLYSLTASTGVLRWGWTSRNLLAKMQTYSTFPGSNSTDGNFSVVDAMNGGVWGSYVVGSLQGGAEHFVFKLDATGKPVTMVYDAVVSGGTVAGDTAAATGNAPLRQPPVIAYIGNSAFMVYVITVGTTSTLYETNIANGATTSAALSFQVSSALYLNPGTNQLWLGGANGSLWATTLTSGTASTDLATILRTGTMVNPATGATVANPLYIGYVEVSGAQHFYAASGSEIEMFNITTTGWTPEWAATTTAGYKYVPSTTSWSTLTGAATLTAGSVVSDFPLVIGNAMLLPVYVAGSGCTVGTGYYDFFGLDSAKFPTDPVIMQDGTAITANIKIGDGPAFTPSVTLISGGVELNKGSQGCTSNCGGLGVTTTQPVTTYNWRQH